MTVRFTWEPGEWREAYRLSTTKPSRSAVSISMGYFIVALMALGGVGDLVHALHNSHGTMRGTLVPVLLILLAVLVLLTTVMFLLRRKRLYRGLPQLPAGEQEVVMHELGWRAGTETGEAPVHAWSELRGQRLGPHVLALLTQDGTTVGVPLRAMTPEQGDWMQRILYRKIPREA